MNIEIDIYRARLKTLAEHELTQEEQEYIIPMIDRGGADALHMSTYIYGTDLLMINKSEMPPMRNKPIPQCDLDWSDKEMTAVCSFSPDNLGPSLSACGECKGE